MSNNYLFNSKGDLHDYLELRKGTMLSEIDTKPAEEIQQIDEEELVQYYLSHFLLKCPTLSEDRKLDYREVAVDVSKDRNRHIRDRSKPFHIKGLQIRIITPFEGDPELFDYQPSPYTAYFPCGEIHGNELHLVIETPDHDEENIKRQIESELRSINDLLRSIQMQVDSYNDSLEPLIRGKIRQRKSKLDADTLLVEALGIPLKKRDDAPVTYTIPKVQKKLPLASSSTRKTNPGYILDQENYVEILRIVYSMSLVMERSPKTFNKLYEEEIRDHFLMFLNGYFEGQVTGETFNYKGKTDILIRVQGKNLFIAECKFWRGEKQFLETIDQLLGYTQWRDTKTAIIIFNKNQNFSSVLSTIRGAISESPYYVRENDLKSDHLSEETISSYVFHQPDDKYKELILTVLAFNIPKFN